MKKIVFAIISIITLLSLPIGLKTAKATETVPTEIVLPSSYLEYLELTAPLDVWTNGNEYVFCELKRIIYFDGTNYKYFELADYSVSKIHMLNDNIVFLSGSKIYTLNIASGEVTEQSSIHVADSFDIKGNVLVTNPSNEIRYYAITDEQNFVTEEIVSKRRTFTYIPTNIAIGDDDTIFYSHGNSIYKVFDNQNVAIAVNISAPRSIAYGNESLFVTFDDGVKKLDLNGAELGFSPIYGEKTLNNLHYPQGCYFFNNELYIADESINCIFKLTDNLAITDFYITTNHNGYNRLSTEAKSICTTDDKVFILDNNAIKVIDQKNQKVNSIAITAFSGLKYIASTADTVLLSSGTNLIFAKITDTGLEPVTINSPTNRFENVSALATFEDNYYILNNETVNNQQNAVVYKFSSNTATIEKHSSIVGRGDALTCDVFGDIYTAVYSETDDSYSVFATDISASKNKPITTLNTPILNISVDYEGNLFSLVNDNLVIKTSAGANTEYTIEVSKNLPKSSSAIDFSVCSATEKAYFLYRGFVLTSPSISLGVATPQKIAIPEGFAITLNSNPCFLTLKQGAKLFEVNLDSAPNFGEYFNYQNMSANADTKMEYVLITTTGRYSLIANSTRCAIVRTEDTLEKQIEKASPNKAGYAVNNCNVYSYPVVKSFTKHLPVGKNDLLTINQTFMFNEREYAFVSSGDKVGFIATSMIKDGIASNLSSSDVKAVSVNSNSTLYYDKEMKEVFKNIEKGTILSVVENKDGTSQVIYDGKVCYVNSEKLEQKSSKVIKNVLVVAILFTALFISGIYLAWRILSYKKKPATPSID